MIHQATDRFWRLYNNLPSDIKAVADKNFSLLKKDLRHPSLHLKQIGEVWSVRVGRDYRALALSTPDGFAWFWIGTQAEYDRLIGQ